MKEIASDDLIRVEDVDQLVSPMGMVDPGRRQAGEEEQDLKSFDKSALCFPSGEALPRCWTDAQYQLP